MLKPHISASLKRLQPYQFLLPLAALIAVLPLILYGPSCGHDFDFHRLNWLEAAVQFRHGNLHPQWTFSPAWNAGEPRFTFYPPLSWTLGGLLSLFAPAYWTPALYTWIALTASGLTMHRLARSFAPPTASLLAATFYLANPYMLFTAYERTAYAELLAAAWIPLLFDAILRKQLTVPRIAVPIALLWLTNAPAAVMGCYAFALLAAIRIAQFFHTQQPKRIAATTAAGTLLGLGLSSVYLLPAAYERRYVQIAMAVIPGLRIQDNTLFHHTGDPDRDAVIHAASLLASLLLALTALALLQLQRTRREAPRSRQLLLPLITLATAVAFLLTPLSLPLWQHLPELAFLQFPWRILALLTAVLSLTLACAFFPNLSLSPRKLSLAALALTAALTIPAWFAFHQACDAPLPQLPSILQSHQGIEPTDEYTPLEADNDALAHTNPPYWLSPNPQAPAPTGNKPGPTPLRLQLTAPTPQFLILNLRDYPAWNVTLNHTPLSAHEQRDDGLIAIAIPQGPINLTVHWRALPDHTLGLLLSLLSAALLLALLRPRSVMIKP